MYNHFMRQDEKEVDRYLDLLRIKLRKQGFNQKDVQEALSWGSSYVSQLLTKQKHLRVDQVLSILHVIGIDPREYFAELYGIEARAAGVGGPETPAEIAELKQKVGDLERQTRRLVKLLVRKQVVTAKEAGKVA